MYIVEDISEDNIYSIRDDDNTLLKLTKPWVDFLSNEGVQFNNCTPNFVSEVIDEFEDGSINDVIEDVEFELNYTDIDDIFENYKYKYFYDILFPLYNFNYVLSESEIISNPKNQLFDIVKFDSLDEKTGDVSCNDGEFVISFEDYMSVYNCFEHSHLAEATKKFINVRDTMAKLIESNNSRHIYLGDIFNNFSYDLKKDWYYTRINNLITKYNVAHDKYIITNFGMICIRNTMKNSIREYASLFLTRYTNLGSVLVTLKDSNVYFGPASNVRKAPIFKDDFDRPLHHITEEFKINLFKSAYEEGLTYYNNFILPICISSIQTYMNSIDIDLICITDYISDSTERWSTGYGQIAIKVPLLLADLKTFYDSTNDTYIFKTLINDIIIPKDMINYLSCSFNERDNITWYCNTNRKQGRNMIKYIKPDLKNQLSLCRDLDDDYIIE